MRAAASHAGGEPPTHHEAAGCVPLPSMRSKPDTEYTANDWLPNTSEATADAERHIPTIVKGVLDGAASGDWHRLMRKSVHGLRRKYRIPQQEREAMVVAMYRVVTEEPSLDQHLQKMFAQQLVRLLKRRDDTRLNVTLPWRPLYRVIELLFFGKARIPQTPLCPYLGYYLVTLARAARVYFPRESSEEVVGEVRPLLCAQHMPSLLKGQVMLVLFLQRRADVSFEFIKEVMGIWGWVVAYGDWDLHWFVLLSSLCRHTHRERSDEWLDLVPAIFSHILHIIDLPVGASKLHIYGSMETSISSPEGNPFFSLASFVHLDPGRSKVSQLMYKVSKLIVYLLQPGGGLPFQMLTRLLKAIESFLHPSNGGFWTHRLAQLLASLCEHFSARIGREKLLSDGAPNKLGPADITAFSSAILPLALQGLYSKSGTATLQSCVALKFLGFLDAPTTLPPLLDRVYQALTTLTEVHQTSSALEVLAAVIFPIIRAGNYEAGAQHIAELMELTLSGIDANDLQKTWATLRFYTVLLSGMPLIPITADAPEGCDPSRHEVARTVTDAFQDWVFRFLDQTFVFIVNQNSTPAATDENKKSDSESKTSEYFFHCTLEVFFVQLGDELFKSALNKVANFCFTNLLMPQQQDHLGVVVSAMTAVHPNSVVHRFLPLCLRILLISPADVQPRTPRTPGSQSGSFRSGSGSVRNNTNSSGWSCSAMLSPGTLVPDAEDFGRKASDNSQLGLPDGVPYKLAVLSEKEIVYYFNIMRHIVENAGAAVLPFRDKIMVAVDLALQVEERPGVISLQVFKAANKLVRALLHALVTCRPREARSVSPASWDRPEWQQRHYESWGHVVSMADADISWRVPSEEGLLCAADLTARYLREPLRVLRAYLDSHAEAPPATVDKPNPAADVNGGGGGGSPAAAVAQNGDEAMPDAAGAGEARGGEGAVDSPRGRAAMAKRIKIVIPQREAGSGKQKGRTTHVQARYAVLQLRYVLEGVVAAMPDWDEGVEEEEEGEAGEMMEEDEDPLLMVGKEEYASGTYELPPVSEAFRGEAHNPDGTLSRSRIGRVLHRAVDFALQHQPDDSRLLQALSKGMDVCLNGVDILQKQSRRLRLRYSIMKARNRETAPDGRAKLLPRYMVAAKLHHHYLQRVMLRHRKLPAGPVVRRCLAQVNELAINPHSTVRQRGQLALLSCCRRYRDSCATSLPLLMDMLEEKEVDAAGHEQRVLGAAALLQTRYFQSRILRDWGAITRFLTALCAADHNDKDSVLDSLDGLFATFLSYWYQITLDMPRYTRWQARTAEGRAAFEFAGYGALLEQLVAIPKSRSTLHWRFKLMVIDAVTVMIRDDVASPPAVWEAIMEGMVSDISHIREACYPALGSALELVQRRQRSKEDPDGSQRRFPDKGYFHWNGPPPPPRPNAFAVAARGAVVDDAYLASVRESVLRYLGNESYVKQLSAAMSVIQLGRAKQFVGSHAQMFKGLLKAFGPQVLAGFDPFLESFAAEAHVPGRESSDVYMGKHCLAAEIVGGMVRGLKYWGEAEQEQARATVCKVMASVLSNTETESFGIWAACLRFCTYDRHPRDIAWLTTLLFDHILPPLGGLGSSSLLACKRLVLVKPVLKELSWRGGPLHRQLLHDLEPYLKHPYAQTRACVGAALAALSWASWQPPWPPNPHPTASSPGGLFPAAAGHEAGDAMEVEGEEGAGLQVAAGLHRLPSLPTEAVLRLVGRATRVWTELAERCAAAKERKTEGEEEEGEDKKDREALRHLRHTLITWICSVVPDYDRMYSCPVEPYLPVLLPPLLQTLEDRDPDISRQARGCIELAANTPMLTAAVLPKVLEAVHSVAKSESWQVRSSVLPFLQIVVFRHQCSISERDMAKVRDLMVSLLADSHVEVREVASAAVSVLVRICGEDLVVHLRSVFLEWAQVQLPGRRRGGGGPAEAESKEEKQSAAGAMQQRHAGVLGLAALVGAYPYDVPSWMPAILVQLATYVLDPTPIKQTVRKAFGEFWRTHQDTWPILKDKFNEEQLSTLTNLLASPSYFS